MSKLVKTRTTAMWRSPGGHFFGKMRQNGKPKWIRLGDDYNEAKRKWFAIRAGKAPVPGPRATVANVAKDWLDHQVAVRRNPKGQTLAKVRVDLYLSAFFADTMLDKVSREDIAKYRLWLEKRSLSAQTVSHVLSDLRALLSWCEDTGRLERTPFPRRVMPKVRPTAPKGFTDAERGKLMELPEPYGFVLRLLLGTGIRWGEACRAQASHVEDGRLVLTVTKSNRVRRVPLGADLLAEVRQHVGLLVPFAASNPGGFSRSVRRITGVAEFHVHRTRHDYAMRWLAGGGSLAALQEILGHADLSTTMRYARATQDLVDREHKRLEEQA